MKFTGLSKCLNEEEKETFTVDIYLNFIVS